MDSENGVEARKPDPRVRIEIVGSPAALAAILKALAERHAAMAKAAPLFRMSEAQKRRYDRAQRLYEAMGPAAQARWANRTPDELLAHHQSVRSGGSHDGQRPLPTPRASRAPRARRGNGGSRVGARSRDPDD